MDLAAASLASFSRSSTVSLAESEIEEACRNHVGIITRQMLEDARRVKKVAVQNEATQGEPNSTVASPRKRRFYAMTTDHSGQEKALDGVWIDSLQELLDEANRAYGAKNDWHDQLRREEQNEQKMQIFNQFIEFSYSGGNGIESVMEHLKQVFKCLSSADKDVDVPSDLDVASLEAVDETLKEAREIGCAQAEKVTRQWFNYLSKEVYNVERFGEMEVKDLEGLKHRLKLLYMYDELNERWHRMDALNAGLEEAVSSKTALQASVESAEVLLVKQVEAEYQKSFEKETKAMIMKVAKQRAETIAQVESCLRHRVNLRNELLRIITELWDKLRTWHPKLCKKFSDGIHQLKLSKKRMEEQLRSAEQKVSALQGKKATLQSALDALLKPYSTAAAPLDVASGLPAKEQLVSKVFAAVAKLEEPMVSPVINDSVERLISRAPHEKMELVAKNLAPKPKEARGLLDFKSIQQLLQYTSAARANEDLAPFLAANQKFAPLLLRGPDTVRLAEMIREYREALVDRNSHASVKLLMSAEPFLKVLSKMKEELQPDSVAAEVGLMLALATFGAVVRVQRGCQLMASILNVRALQLRKHALNRILNEPFPAQTYENMKAEVRKIEASYLVMEGGISTLRKQAETLAKDATSLLKLYGKTIDDLVQATKRLSPKTNQAYGRRMSNAEVDFSRSDFSPRRNEESLAYLPALLAFQKSGEASAGQIMTILKYQKALLKLQLSSRRWLRAACSGNLDQEELLDSEEALQRMKNWWWKRHPEYEESSESSPESGKELGAEISGDQSPRSRVARGLTRSASMKVGLEREISHISAGSDGQEPILPSPTGSRSLVAVAGPAPRISGPEAPGGPPRWRRWSDILHDRPLQPQVSQLTATFEEELSAQLAARARDLATSSSSSGSSEKSVQVEEAPEVKEMRSKATFLNWSRGTQSTPPPRRGAQGRVKGLALSKAAAKGVKGATKVPEAKVYTNLMGREVLQPEPSAASQSESEGHESYETCSDSEDSDPQSLPEGLPPEQELEPGDPLVAPRVLMEIPKSLSRRELPRHPREQQKMSLLVGDPQIQSPGSPGSPEARHRRKGRLFSPRAPGDTTGFRLEGVKVTKRSTRVAQEEPSQSSSEEEEQEEPKATKEQKLTRFKAMRTPTLVDGSGSQLDLEERFLLVDDVHQTERSGSRSPSESGHETRSQGDASPGSRSAHSLADDIIGPPPLLPAGARRSRGDDAEAASASGSSPQSRSMTETTRWLLEVLDAERQSLAARQVPRTGRAFPTDSGPGFTPSGPPGTARRMKLRERPTSRPSTATVQEPGEIPAASASASPCAPGSATWRCLPRAPGGDWKLLAAEAVPPEEEHRKEEELEVQQVVRLSSQSFDFEPAAACGAGAGRGRRHLGRARMYVSSSNWNLAPSPPSSAASVDLEHEDGDAEAPVPPTPAERDAEADGRETEVPTPDLTPGPTQLVQLGPTRQGLPMTRRGVAQLLTQHEAEPQDLELLGASLRPRPPRYLLPRVTVAAVEPTVVQPVVVQPVVEKVEKAVDEPIFVVAESEAPGGVERIQSAASLSLLSPNRPPRHGVTMTEETLEDMAAEFQGFFTENGSLRPTSDHELNLSFIAQQAVAAAADCAAPAEPAAESDIPKVRPSSLIVRDMEPQKEQRAKSHPKPRTVQAAVGTPRPPWERWKPGPILSQLVGASSVAPDPSSSVEDHLRSWRMRPGSAACASRPPSGSKIHRRGI